MKKMLFLILGIWVSQAGLSQQSPYQTYSFNASEIVSLEAMTSGGGIQVGATTDAQARVDVYIFGNGSHKNLSKEEIQSRLASDYDLSVQLEGHELKAVAKRKNKFFDNKNSLNIGFKIYVPEKTSSQLSTSGGSIELNGLTGQQEFSTSGGGLAVQHLKGRIHGTTSGGSIEATDCQDDIELQTSGGGIAATQCSGKIKLNTSGGSIELKQLSGTVEAHSSGGSIEIRKFNGELVTSTSGGSVEAVSFSGSLKASTSGGNLSADMDLVDKYLTLENSGGSIRIILPKDKGYNLNLTGSEIGKSVHLQNFSGTVKDNSIQGTLNGGGAQVTAGTSGGTIHIEYK